MHKRLLVFYTLMAGFGLIASAQSVIQIPFNSRPTIDGVLSSGEWTNSDSVFINIAGNRKVKVQYAHDSMHLHFAFVGNLESSNARFPEIVLDINHNGGSSWSSDDWWFHASGTDCEYQGQHSNYDSCQLVRPNWKAERNFLQNTPPTDTVEIEIPFSTIALDLSNTDTIGITFDVTNTFNLWEFWPQSANLDEPGTWGDAVFLAKGNTGINNLTEGTLQLYPNPANTYIQTGFTSQESYTVSSITGKLLQTGQIPTDGTLRIDSLDANNVYILRVFTPDGIQTGRFAKMEK